MGGGIMLRRLDLRVVLSGLVLAVAVAGCSIHASKDNNGQDKDVDIKTPLGSISVHKGEGDAKETGLALYPGAQLSKDHGDGGGSANVNISSSLFGLKVAAGKYHSDDSPDKVLGFYRKEMAKYGKVVDCTGGFAMTFHHHDQDSQVSCDDHDNSGHDYREELKVGTQNNQRIVAVRPSGSGSEFALVYVRARDDKSTM
jgi:hypothetical protein